MNNSENYRNIYNDIKDFVFIIDKNGVILDVNSAVKSTISNGENDLIGKDIDSLKSKEFNYSSHHIVNSINDDAIEEFIFPIESKNGVVYHFETKCYPTIWNQKNATILISRTLSRIALSEEKFEEVFNSSQTNMIIYDRTRGKVVDVNQSFMTLFGLQRKDVVGEGVEKLDIFYDEGIRAMVHFALEMNQQLCKEEAILNGEFGVKLDCLISVSSVNIQACDYVLISIEDISNVKAIESKLKTSLIQQSLLADISQMFNSSISLSRIIDKVLSKIGKHVDVSRVYIFEEDETAQFISNSYEWCNSTITPQKDSLQDIPYAMIPSWKPLLLKNGKIFSSFIEELPGDIYQLLVEQEIKSIIVFPLFIKGEMFGFIGFDECVVDREWTKEEIEFLRTVSGIISTSYERNNISNQLKEREEQLHLAISNTETGLWDWNIKTGDVFFNDMWCSMIGYAKDEILPRFESWVNLLHPDDLVNAEIELKRHFAGETDVYEVMIRLKTKIGDWKWVLAKGKVVEWDEDGAPLRAIGTHTDIDEQKKAEAELRVSNATKDKFFSIIAHDLRGPIGNLMQISELVSHKDSLSEVMINKLMESQKSVTKSTYSLLENLLQWAEFNKDEITYKPTQFELLKVVDESIDAISFQAVKKEVSVKAITDNMQEVFADENMVRLIIRNILSNGLKFTPKNGEITLGIYDTDERVVVKISDNGVGISQENIAKILSEDEFFTTQGTEREKGTGLGLKLCKSFAEANKGTLKIESEVGRGTVFSFDLPKVGCSE